MAKYKLKKKSLKENTTRKTFFIHDEAGNLIMKVYGYDKALKTIKQRNFSSQLNFLKGNNFVMVYAHVPHGHKLIPSQMSSTMKKYNIKPNVEYKEKLEEIGKNIIPKKIKSFNESKRGGNTMKKMNMQELRLMISEVLTEENGYQDFFKATLKKYGVKSPGELDDTKKKEFFNYIETNWKGKNETLEPVSAAAGNPLKRVKAKKRDQMLASEAKVEQYIRKLVREELSFVMFNDGNPLQRIKARKRDQLLASSKS